MNNVAIMASWKVYSFNENYYISSHHYNYLSYLSKKYNKIYLISPHYPSQMIVTSTKTLVDLDNVLMKKIPPYNSYIDAMKYFFVFFRHIVEVKDDVDLFYTVSPDPFCWLPALIISKDKRVIHYVSDLIKVTQTNIKWSRLKKKLMLFFYLPEYLLALLASKYSTVYANGKHLTIKLEKYGIKATPVISSTIRKDELPPVLHELSKSLIRITFIGALRYSKGIDTMMRLISLLEKRNINYLFNIVGDGEMYLSLKKFLANNKIHEKVVLHGNVNDRSSLLKILRQSDLFYFPSLSEGSPRVVIEAMSQGVPVISTPVGSLPSTFKEKTEILFFGFNDEEESFKLIEDFFIHPQNFISMREKAFNKVSENYTIENFLDKVFHI